MSNPAAIAHLEQVLAYYRDPAQAPHRTPPAPPTEEIGYELAAAVARMIATFLDYLMTGEPHVDDPSVEAVLMTCQLLEDL